MEEKNDNVSGSTDLQTTYQGVCDYPVCNFHTDCKSLGEIQQLCDAHNRSHPGHEAFPLAC